MILSVHFAAISAVLFCQQMEAIFDVMFCTVFVLHLCICFGPFPTDHGCFAGIAPHVSTKNS
jgi:hypothetical protein